jgi:HK97 gp10 family phage protein
MMGGFTAKVVGLHELDAKLSELGDKAAKRIMGAGLRAAGEVFAEAVRARAPVRSGGAGGSALPPGALKNDIGYHVGGTEDGGRPLPAVFVRPGKYTQRVANWVEYGHRQVHGGYLKLNRATGQRRGPGRETGAVPAHPFIRPAYEAARERAAQACCDAIAKGVEKAAKQ